MSAQKCQTNNPIFFIYFFRCLFVSALWSILVFKIPQFLAKNYRFGQLTILFQKVDTTARLLKIYIIMFCPPTKAKCRLFRLQLIYYFYHLVLSFFYMFITLYISIFSDTIIWSSDFTVLSFAFVLIYIYFVCVLIFFTSSASMVKSFAVVLNI